MGIFVIIHNVKHEIIVEKSRFIAYIKPIESEEDFIEFKALIKLEEKGARHYPYAYSYYDVSKASDDGEPSGTAGRPLLDLIDNHHLSNIAIIVVRYFGGIKLGAGRLLRTYVEAAKQGLSQLVKYEVVPGYIYNAKIRGADLGQIEYLLTKYRAEIIKREFHGEEVVIFFKADATIDVNSILNIETKRQEKCNIYRKEE